MKYMIYNKPFLLSDIFMITIAIDMMGGDAGLAVTAPACADFLNRYSDAHLLLVGQEDAIYQAFQAYNHLQERWTIIPATEIVAMDEAPQHALKHKKDSSMRVAINQVKEGTASAAVSAGNTGALMATAKFVLKTLNGIQRPAIAKFLPTKNNDTICALDLGANVDCPSEQLLQFAVMGSQLVKAMHPEKSNPRVALLNIGTEEIKGTDTIKMAYSLLSQSQLNFVGNMEGSEIFDNRADVMVCDGFVGNIALKTIEGTAHFMGNAIKNEFKNNLYSKFSAVLALPVLNKFKKQFDPRRYNGAIFLGLRGIVIKSHGGTDALGFGYAIEEAYREAQTNLLSKIEEAIAVELTSIEENTTKE